MKSEPPIRPTCMDNSNKKEVGASASGSGVLDPSEEAEDEESARVIRLKSQSAEEAAEAREIRAPPIPVTPSGEEVAKHRLTHRPFRSWCAPTVSEANGGPADTASPDRKERRRAFPNWCPTTSSLVVEEPLAQRRGAEKRKRPRRMARHQ